MKLITILIWFFITVNAIIYLRKRYPQVILTIFGFWAVPYSVLVRWLARLSMPDWFKTFILPIILKILRIDLSKATKKSLNEYNTFEEIFIREPEKIDVQSGDIVSPCQGKVIIVNNLGERDLPVKSRLIPFDVSSFPSKIGIYLSPGDFHIVYSPTEGEILDILSSGKYLGTVCTSSFLHLPAALLENTSTWFKIKSREGILWLGMVGAVGVRSVRILKDATRRDVQKGEKLAHFELGSFVWIFLERKIEFRVQPGESLVIGQNLI